MKKEVIAVMVAILLVGLVAGCTDSGGGDGGGGAQQKGEPVQMTATIGPITEWVPAPDSSEGGSGEASHTFPLNGTVTKIKFTCSVKDSDSEHSETDEGSEPDTVSMKVTGGNDTEKKQAKTPGTMEIEFSGSEETPLANSWTVKIKGEKYGGGKAAYFFGFIVYVDQGFEYTLNVEYTYLEYPNAPAA